MAVVCTLLAMLLLSTDEAEVLPLKEEPEVGDRADDIMCDKKFANIVEGDFGQENEALNLDDENNEISLPPLATNKWNANVSI